MKFIPANLTIRLVGLAFALSVLGVGCSWSVDSTRRIARLTDWGSSPGVQARRRPKNRLERPMSLWTTFTGHGGLKPAERTRVFLRTHALENDFRNNPEGVLGELRRATLEVPDLERLHVLAELAYIEGHRSRLAGDQRYAGQMLATAVLASYQYLFDPRLEQPRNEFDPVFRKMCDTYNAGLEGLLRIMRDEDALRPGGKFTATTLDGQTLHIAIRVSGRWRDEDFVKFEFVADFDAEGIKNVYHTYGLGVPLIGVRQGGGASENPGEEFYPAGLTPPLTAFATATISESGEADSDLFLIELIDPLERTEVKVADRYAPLESDISTPLAYYLNDPLLGNNWFATAALLNGDFAEQFGGLYMLEPFDPTKIPVLLVHGFWSSPMTWTEMFNDLRADKTLRDNYQFWFYLYPSGQPFWFSARQMRCDLARVRQKLDPHSTSRALNEMVLVGHSMGGLVSRLQVMDSKDRFWSLVSDRDISELKGNPETRQRVCDTLFFNSNPAISRVITIASPHRGSTVSNSLTQWLSQKLIALPTALSSEYLQIMKENPDFFKSDMLKIATSTDALSPDSKFFEAMLEAETSPRVRFHNIIGVHEATGAAALLQGTKEASDGVVSVSSARMEDSVSEIEVPAEHSRVHEHPRAVLEVRRILYEHLEEVLARAAAGRREPDPDRVAPAALLTSESGARHDASATSRK